MSNAPETDALREAIDNGAATEAEMTSLASKLERERNEAREVAERYRRKTVSQDAELAEAHSLLAVAKESLNAIHVEVGGWIAAMMKEEKQTLPTVAKTQNTNEHRTK
jgi:hypothetical protein